MSAEPPPDTPESGGGDFVTPVSLIGETINFHWKFIADDVVGEVRRNTANYIGMTNTGPEPASLALVAMALFALAGARRRA